MFQVIHKGIPGFTRMYLALATAFVRREAYSDPTSKRYRVKDGVEVEDCVRRPNGQSWSDL